MTENDFYYSMSSPTSPLSIVERISQKTCNIEKYSKNGQRIVNITQITPDGVIRIITMN